MDGAVVAWVDGGALYAATTATTTTAATTAIRPGALGWGPWAPAATPCVARCARCAVGRRVGRLANELKASVCCRVAAEHRGLQQNFIQTKTRAHTIQENYTLNVQVLVNQRA